MRRGFCRRDVSPILPDSRLFSCPFLSGPLDPSLSGPRFDEFSAPELLRLGGGRALHPNRSCHFDPMLEGAQGPGVTRRGSISRHEVKLAIYFCFSGGFGARKTS